MSCNFAGCFNHKKTRELKGRCWWEEILPSRDSFPPSVENEPPIFPTSEPTMLTFVCFPWPDSAPGTSWWLHGSTSFAVTPDPCPPPNCPWFANRCLTHGVIGGSKKISAEICSKLTTMGITITSKNPINIYIPDLTSALSDFVGTNLASHSVKQPPDWIHV